VRQTREVHPGEIVVAGIGNDEATVKTLQRRGEKIVLVPSNPSFTEMEFDEDDVDIYGRVVTVLRKL
jgi:repressor LexA